jgi:hypothetical protein
MAKTEIGVGHSGKNDKNPLLKCQARPAIVTIQKKKKKTK